MGPRRLTIMLLVLVSGPGSIFAQGTGGPPLTIYTNPAPEISHGFGVSVAAVGSDRVLIGAFHDNASVGAAYLFDFPASSAPQPGSLDPAFAPEVSGAYVNGTAVQPGGEIVLTGNFDGVNGQTRHGIARLQSDGTAELTATFNPGTGVNFWTSASAVQTDGKIVVGGAFSTVNGQPRNRIARFSANGRVESTAAFNPGTGASGRFSNGDVHSLAAQADGKILLAGQFTHVNGQARMGIARLNANGTVESIATFNPGTGAGTGAAGTDAHVYCVAVQADGKILLGGDFTTVNGQPRNRIARLLPNGTVESTATFNPGTGVNSGTDVFSLVVQADGKILIGGNFATVNGEVRNGIARLLADGTLESTATFNPGTDLRGIRGITLQADGKILLGGGPFGGAGITRLHGDGTVESTTTFNSHFGDQGYLILSVALQADGKILVGGSFTSVDGQPRNRIARLANDAASQSLVIPDGTRAHWFRGGSAPEVEQVTFEVSTNSGADWSLLGPGTRIPGGWELNGLSLPGSGSLRARGRTTGGSGNNASGLVESVVTFPAAPPLSVALVSDGVLLRFSGIPGSSYNFERAPAVTGPWSIRSTLTAPSAGLMEYLETPVPVNSAFYRINTP